MKRAPHIPVNEKTFRRQKRKEFNQILKAFKAFRSGSAYTNADLKDINVLDNILKNAHDQLKPWWYNR